MAFFRRIEPSSIYSSFKEEYEYLLNWISPNGGVRQWLFSSTDGRRQDKFKSIVIDTDSDYRSVPNTQDITIDVSSQSLSRDRFEYVSTLLKSNRIYLVSKSGVLTPVSIMSSNKNTVRNIKDYSISFKIKLQEPDILNV